jgi:putative ABC transport system permease protein
MLKITFGSIRSRLGNVMGALIAMTISTALIAATCLLLFSASDAKVSSDRFGATSMLIQIDPTDSRDENGDGTLATTPRIPAETALQVADVPGVDLAIPDFSFYAQLLDRNGAPLSGPDGTDSFGMPWTSAALTPFTLASGGAPSAPDEIVIDENLAAAGQFAVGDHVTLISSEMPASYRISGIAEPPDGDGLPRQATIFFSTETALRLAGLSETVDQIGVIAAAGESTKTVEDAVVASLNDPGLRILTGNDIAKADPTSDLGLFEDVTAILGTMAGFSGFVSIFVLAGTFAFSILQRNREIGLLRAVGMTPRQIRLMIATEALGLAIIGSIIAFPVGIGIAELIARALTHFDFAPAGFHPSVNVWSFLIAIGSSIGISQLAVFGAARRGSKIGPIEALRESSAPARLISIRRLFVGLVFAIGGVVALGISSGLPTDAQVAMSLGIAVLLLIAASRLGPILVLPFTWGFGLVLGKLMKTPGELARLNSRHAANRVASVASPLMLAAGFACLMFFLVATTQTATIDQSNERTTAEIVVMASSPGLPLALTDEIASLPGVEAVSPVIRNNATLIKHRETYDQYNEYTLSGVDPQSIGKVMNLNISEGSLADFTGNTMMMSRMGAEMEGGGATLGKTYNVALPDGTRVSLKLAAIYDNSLGIDDILIPAELAAAHASQPLAQEFYVSVAPDADREAVRHAIETLGASMPTMQVLSRDDYVGGIRQSAVDGAWAIYLIVGVSVLFAAIAVINTMTMSTSERVHEFALLRLIGGTTHQIKMMVFGESLIVLVLGLTIGIGIGILCMIPVSQGLQGDLSALTVPPLELTAVILISTVIVLAAHLIPARYALNVNPIENIGMKQ